MQTLNLDTKSVFRPIPDNIYELSFVPELQSGTNFVIYSMHWIQTDKMEPVLCLEDYERGSCPICALPRSGQYMPWRAKKRVLINIWISDDSKPKVWDVNLFLLSQGLDTISLTDPQLFDESKYGAALTLVIRKRGPGFPEYKISKELRRIEIPTSILSKTYNLNNLVIKPKQEDVIKILEQSLNSDIRRNVQITEAVGEVFSGKRTTPESDKILQPIITAAQKKKYQEPEPYKRAKRIIIMDEEESL